MSLTALVTMLRILPAWCYWLFTVAALCLAANLHGRRTVHAQWDADKDRKKQAIQTIAAKQDIVTTQTITQYINRDRIVHVQGATLIQQVPIYVTKQNDLGCTINNGFVRLWNAANSGVQLPGTAARVDDQASGIGLSDVATRHSVEATYTRRLEVQLSGLQKWIDRQRTISIE
ncbi:hypothetical protein [Glaciimonas sp. PAMC28666]|uniref:hypothetical protein n=1 Tax=Glaciimonas sp. PAMC28666 TaxID=2807626 RepID=UPI0019664F94|nr:hypothetical protein [Glaciimonas sp. PAMC28666]QRX82261.1 hypothetical protein JQN73_19550 [Glaciimonas sp. PAMC28666]